MSDASNDNLSDAMRGFRRRWASGVAVVTLKTEEGSLRGITVTALIPVSLEPPVLAVAISAEGEFVTHIQPGTRLGVSVLDARHEFWSERFAGRAPVPDRAFAGIGHTMVAGAPLIDGALARCAGRIRTCEAIGDHWLVTIDVDRIESGRDTDDPLLVYEGRYRRLEAG